MKAPASRRTASARRTGPAGGRTSRSGRGAPCARTTAPAARRGATSPTTTPARGPTAGTRTASAASATPASTCASPSSLWNGRDPFLKERMFGLTGPEGNHGEDVKEYYFYLDSTPTHSYMKYLYKYPQAEFPYARLVEENRLRDKTQPEFELVDTGIFDESRYFDVVVEYAKAAADDILIRISVTNRGPEAAPIEVLPTLWFRNTWSWGRDDRRPPIAARGHEARLLATHWDLGEYALYCSGADELLFTENETNTERLYGVPSPTPYVKDAFHACVVGGRREAVNPAATGTKAAARYARTVGAGETVTIELRLASAEWREPARRAFRRLRRGVPAAQGGGGRVLRRRPAARPFARCPAGGAPGTRRDAVVQAVLPLRRQRLAGRRPGAAEPAARAPAGAQPPVDAPVRPRRDLDARQVGVPLVRRLGPGLPLRCPRARRPAVRQGADPPDAAGVVHAPQRADPRLRMGLRRRQPAGPLHGRGRGVRDRAPPHGGRRLRVPRSASSTRCSSTSPGG